MRMNRLDKKIFLSTVAAFVMGWSLQAIATDFALQNNSFTVLNAASNASPIVSADGSATASPTIPVSPTDYGMPTFALGLNASAIQTGEHIFWAAVEITGNSNDKYLRAFLPELFMTVAEDGSFTGEVKATTNLTVRVESEGQFLQIELEDQADDSVSFAGQTLQFDASNLLALLGAADGQSAQWQGMAQDFNTSDSYSYKIYIGPRDYGVQGARVGITSGNGFVPFPISSAPFLIGDEAHVIQGSFNTSSTSSLPLISNVAGPAGAESVTLRGGVAGNGSQNFFKQAAFSVGEAIALNFSIEPPPSHVGSTAVIILGIVIDSEPNTIYLLSSSGELVPFDGVQVIGAAQVPLQASNTLSVPATGSIPLTAGLEGVYQFFIGYQLLGTGALFYGTEPVVVEVN